MWGIPSTFFRSKFRKIVYKTNDVMGCCVFKHLFSVPKMFQTEIKNGFQNKQSFPIEFPTFPKNA